MIRLGIDAMGGDFAPENVILGAIDALSCMDSGTELVLIGDSRHITEVCRHYGVDSGNFVIVNASQRIEMGERPVEAYNRKSDSSINIGFRSLAEGRLDAFASAGNTGAMLVGSVKTLGLLPGIIRPCISALVPLFNGQNMLILDVGLNTDTRAEMLCQFAVLGSLYAKTVMGVARPRVALLNIGAEPGKGDSTTAGAYRMLEKGGGDFDFVGNMEANALFNGGMADVLVTEGFVGNICLKQTEGMYELIARLGVAHPFFKRFNYEYYGGTPVLGITAPVVIGHGVSTPVAIKNMILEAEKVVKCDLVSRLKDALAIENKDV